MTKFFAAKKICVALLIVIAAMQIFSLFVGFDCSPLIAACGCLLPFFAFSSMNTSFKRMSWFFLGLGALINLVTNQPLQAWVEGVNYMLNIASILVIMQLFTIPIKLNDYEATMRWLILRTFKNERSLYLFTLAVIHLFSSFLLFGTIPVMLSLLQQPLKKVVGDYRQFISTALTRSYAMVVMWAPGAVNILLVVTATGANWLDMFFIGVVLCLWGIFLAYFVQRKKLSNNPFPQAKKQTAQDKQIFQAAYRKLLFIFCIVICLVMLIIFFGWLDFGNNTSRVMLASLIISGVWLLTFISNPGLPCAISEYLNVSLVKTIDLAVLYVALGVFSKALEASEILPMFYPVVACLADTTGIFMLPAISLLVFFLSLIGLHPFIILVVLGKIIVSLNLPFAPAVIAIALVFGSSLSYMTSPFAGIVLTCAKYLEVTAYQVGCNWNGGFALLYFLSGSVLIMLWSILGS